MTDQSPSYLTRSAGLVVGLIAAATFFIFVYAGEVERGKIAAFSMAAVLASMRISWDYRHEKIFWLLASIFFALHVALIFLISWNPERNPAMIFAPFAIADIFLEVFLYEFSAKKLGWQSVR
ncbi:hypothetical protein [Silvimonas sp.]|uniref:hypothetical protein n=1 Tax=Silvimonas sp. TaxID=2650811 RepID=UPI002847A66F|nr:hypothetical protein [Silvimonas sp.]MDR3425826.1 hypothetical protein [Silvimonas sp.]